MFFILAVTNEVFDDVVVVFIQLTDDFLRIRVEATTLESGIPGQVALSIMKSTRLGPQAALGHQPAQQVGLGEAQVPIFPLASLGETSRITM